MPESADVIEAELAERARTSTIRGRRAADAERAEAGRASRADVGRPEQADEPGRRDRPPARAQAGGARAQARAKESAERRRAPKAPTPERQRGGVIGFLHSCWAELKQVQWPDRETLDPGLRVTVLFIAIAAAYLGALDTIFNFLVQHLL